MEIAKNEPSIATILMSGIISCKNMFNAPTHEASE